MKKIILGIIAIILIALIALLFIVNNNKAYESNMLKEINKNYPKDVKYVNKYGSNYIIKTKDDVIVLDDEYKEVTKEKISDIKELNYELVYRKNSIMYQKSEVKGRNVIYTYYDIKSGKYLDKVEIEG